MLPQKGIVISNGLANEYGLSEGDMIKILGEYGVPQEVVITNIYRNYAGRFLFISYDYASEKFNWDIRSNAYLIDSKVTDAALITLLFSALINWIVLRKVRTFKMTDINK